MYHYILSKELKYNLRRKVENYISLIFPNSEILNNRYYEICSGFRVPNAGASWYALHPNACQWLEPNSTLCVNLLKFGRLTEPTSTHSRFYKFWDFSASIPVLDATVVRSCNVLPNYFISSNVVHDAEITASTEPLIIQSKQNSQSFSIQTAGGSFDEQINQGFQHLHMILLIVGVIKCTKGPGYTGLSCS